MCGENNSKELSIMHEHYICLDPPRNYNRNIPNQLPDRGTVRRRGRDLRQTFPRTRVQTILRGETRNKVETHGYNTREGRDKWSNTG